VGDHDRPKVAVVTGGGAGIGAAAGARLAQDGMTVVLVDRDRTAVTATATRIAEAGNVAHPISADVAVDAELAGVADEVRRRWGSCSVLVCAAGIQRYGTVDETSAELFDEVVGVNFRGVFLTAHHMVPLLRAAGGGSIVVVSSVQAIRTQQRVAAYTASKGALSALVRAMAVDHAAEGIRVNAVSPGSVNTPMLRHSATLFSHGRPADDVIAEWGRAHPLGRVAEPDEIADVIAFLAGPGARFVTGADINVDGGLLATLSVALPETVASGET
jgi:NAD(P)-dependent dehydrogenase (short-subunit alcohol dehydrogenase family)